MSIFFTRNRVRNYRVGKVAGGRITHASTFSTEKLFVQERESEGEDDYVIFLFDEYYLVSTCIGVVLLGQFFTG